jgi:hypothetical protein
MDERSDCRTADARTSTQPGRGGGEEPGTRILPGGGAVIPPEPGTETVPASMADEFSSLSGPYCWVITEDLVAGYDGAAPSTVGRYGPPQAELRDVHEALSAGRWFRLAGSDGQPRVVGRIYDPTGENERAPLDGFGAEEVDAAGIEYRAGGHWEAV